MSSEMREKHLQQNGQSAKIGGAEANRFRRLQAIRALDAMISGLTPNFIGSATIELHVFQGVIKQVKTSLGKTWGENE